MRAPVYPCLFVLLLLLAPMVVVAQDVDATLGNATSSFEELRADVEGRISTILAFDQYTSFVEILFLFVVITTGIFLVMNGVFNGFDWAEILTFVITVFFVRILITGYDSITDALWGWAVGFAGAIQLAALGSDDFGAPVEFIARASSSVYTGDYNLLLSPALWLTSVIVMLFAAALQATALLVGYWAFWGYAVAKVIGLMFVPLLLWEKASFLFDGWLRFLFGFLLFTVLARINITLLSVLIGILYGVDPLSTDVPGVVTEDLTINDVIGLIAIFAMGILALIASGSHAGAIVRGGSFGFGGALRTGASAVSGRLMGSRRR